uniref:Uncharacterized protein n=1 Tax=Phenylobacterium glaciei TaxID=2803784 RepID=A0A974P1L7_9CAUL|nr:hypothetical protein JKL49_21825 [Phenylobacterium glaciei]
MAKPMDAAERRDVIEKLATALKANFLFPDIGARYAGQLRANLARAPMKASPTRPPSERR